MRAARAPRGARRHQAFSGAGRRMTRRPRSKLPPRLPDTQPEPRRREHAAPATTPRGRLIAARVAGPHPRLGKRRGRGTRSRASRPAPTTPGSVSTSARSRATRPGRRSSAGWGWSNDRARAVIDPARTLAASTDAVALLRRVGADGGRVAAAAGAPSLLPLVRALVAEAAAAGAQVLECDEWGPFGRAARSLWWLDRVAVVTDGVGLGADDGRRAGAGVAVRGRPARPRGGRPGLRRRRARGRARDGRAGRSRRPGLRAGPGTRPAGAPGAARLRPGAVGLRTARRAGDRRRRSRQSGRRARTCPTRQHAPRGHTLTPKAGERGEPRGAVLCKGALPDRSGSRRLAASVIDDGLPTDQGGRPAGGARRSVVPRARHRRRRVPGVALHAGGVSARPSAAVT